MAVSNSRTRCSGPVLSYGFQRSNSPSERFCSSSSTTAFASTSSSFSSRSTGFFNRSAPPTRIDRSVQSSPSVRFPIDRSISPSRSIAVSPRDQVVRKQSNPLSTQSAPRRTCMCSPTNHPGSFRCSLHKGVDSHHHQSDRIQYESFLQDRFGRLEAWRNSSAVKSMNASANRAPSPLQSTSSFPSSSSLFLNLPAKG